MLYRSLPASPPSVDALAEAAASLATRPVRRPRAKKVKGAPKTRIVPERLSSRAANLLNHHLYTERRPNFADWDDLAATLLVLFY